MAESLQSRQSLTSAVAADPHLARRALAVVGLCGIALVHLLDVESKLGEVPYLGAMFIGLIVASLVLAEGLLRRDDLLLWLAVARWPRDRSSAT